VQPLYLRCARAPKPGPGVGLANDPGRLHATKVFVADVLFSLATALFLTVLFAVGFARATVPLSYRWWLELAGFFALIFLSSWAGGVWLRKAPAIGLAAPYVAAIAIATLFLVATSRASRASSSASGVAARPDVAVLQAVLFVILMVVLAVVIVFGYGPAA
jgi:hypothetical protein